MFVRNSGEWLIDSGDGTFVDFDGIQKLENRQTIEVVFDGDSSIICTNDHLLKTKNNVFKTVSSLRPGDELANGAIVRYTRNLTGLRTVYDIVNSETKSYLSNNVISHNCSFVGSSNTLIESSILNTLVYINPLDEKNDVRYFKYPEKDHSYVITVDVSRGRGLDYTAFIVVDISSNPYNIVCTFKNNTISPNVELPVLLNRIGRLYNQALILVENNDLGESVGNALWFDWEYENLLWTHNEQIAGHGTIGVKTTRKVKSVGTNAMKSLIENHQLKLNDYRIIQELSVYVRQKRGLYGAQDTSINDDLCSCVFLMGWLTQQNYFQDLTDSNINKKIGQKFVDDVDDYLPSGFYVDGVNDSVIDMPYLTEDQISLLR